MVTADPILTVPLPGAGGGSQDLGRGRAGGNKDGEWSQMGLEEAGYTPRTEPPPWASVSVRWPLTSNPKR